jgi:hypothetical protein
MTRRISSAARAGARRPGEHRLRQPDFRQSQRVLFWYDGEQGRHHRREHDLQPYISDLETCFKLMPIDLYRSLDIRSAGSGWRRRSPQLRAARFARTRYSISHRARTREEGKKITWRDGVQALWILARERGACRGARSRVGADS